MNVLEKFKHIKTFVFDMDGVLTDGTLYVASGVEWIRKMHIRDGHALHYAIKKGYRIAVISGSLSKAVKERLFVLGVKDVFMMIADKKRKLNEYIELHNLEREEILYMGDDIPDLEIMQTAGLPCCPADSVSEVKEAAHYISSLKGGEGCVRDVIEKVLKLNGHWNSDAHASAV